MSDGTNKEAVETAVRDALVARAAAVRTEPDLPELRRRIERSSGRRRNEARLGVAALVLLVAAVSGGAVGSLLARQHLTHTSLSAKTGSDAGRLPTGPPASLPAGDGIVAVHLPTLSLRDLTGGGVVLDRTSDDVSLRLAARFIDPVVVSAGAEGAGCYAGELVTTAASIGPFRSGGLSVVGTEPLAPTDLEVVGSGSIAVGGGSVMWWATVAVGSDVARVATESPAHTTDAVTPRNGLAVLGGLVPVGERTRFFSAVAETASGSPLGSLGFLLGYGTRLDGPHAGAESSTSAGCVSATAPFSPSGRHTSPSSSDLLAASSVVAAFHQAYDGTAAGGSGEVLAAVADSSRLDPGGHLASAGRPHVLSVQVGEVRFVSPSRAEVTYRLAGGEWRAGTAVRSRPGTWRVGTVSYCADVDSLPPAGRPLPGLGPACAGLLAG